MLIFLFCQEPKNYAFSYKVVDHLTGDDFSHTQSQNSRATNGEYRVKLPDGRVQIVSYIADKNGYKADVKYTENDIPTQNIQIQHIPATPIPILQNSYDYQYGSHLPTYAKNLHAPSKLYADYDSHKTVHLPRVQIYPNGLTNYVGSTVAPYLLKDYQENVVASTVTPTYSPVYTVY